MMKREGQHPTLEPATRAAAGASTGAPVTGMLHAKGLIGVDGLGLPRSEGEMARSVAFTSKLISELRDTLDVFSPDPHLVMILELMRRHFDAKVTTPSLLIQASGVPYATGSRRLKEMIDADLVGLRPRTRTGKSFTLHPTRKLINQWQQLGRRLSHLVVSEFGQAGEAARPDEYYFGGSYLQTKAIPPLQSLSDPITLAGGLRFLVHGDPTFMVMDSLKKHFEHIFGCAINQRAFSIDRLHGEALRNAARKHSRYDLIAVNLPWVGEFAEKGVLLPLDDVMDVEQLDPADFHPAGWLGTTWGGKCYGIPTHETSEVLFYRRDLFEEKGLAPPATTDQLLDAARAFHDPGHHRYGIAWNAARGTALGHTFLMAMADFGQPVIDLEPVAGGYDIHNLKGRKYHATIDTEAGLRAAEFLLEMMKYSPPAILTMSWYERIRCYAAGEVAMAYGFTQMAPYLELGGASPAQAHTGYLPHPAGGSAPPISPVGGYAVAIPANLPPERLPDALRALAVVTSPQAQKMFIQSGGRSTPRYSVGEDPEVRDTSPVFELIDDLSRLDRLQCWPRPQIPELEDIIQALGTLIHDMLRGNLTPREALRSAQQAAEEAIGRSRAA